MIIGDAFSLFIRKNGKDLRESRKSSNFVTTFTILKNHTNMKRLLTLTLLALLMGSIVFYFFISNFANEKR